MKKYITQADKLLFVLKNGQIIRREFIDLMHEAISERNNKDAEFYYSLDDELKQISEDEKQGKICLKFIPFDNPSFCSLQQTVKNPYTFINFVYNELINL